MRKSKQLIIFIFSIIMMALTTQSVYAFTPNDSGETNITSNPGTWCQWCTSADGAQFDYNTLKLGWRDGGAYDMGGSGCAQFSITYILRKAEIKGSDFDPRKLKEWNDSVSEDRSTVNSGGAATWNTGSISEGKLVFGGRVGTLEEAKKLFQGGYYVILHTSGDTSAGHWVALDEIRDGDVYVVDSAAKGENGQVNFSKEYKNFVFGDSVFFKPADGVTPSVKAKTVSGVSSQSSGPGVSNDVGNFKMISEEDLHGMPTVVSLGEGVVIADPPAYNDFSDRYKNILADLKETRKLDKENYGLTSYLSIGVSILGILLMMWAVLQVAIYLLDWVLQGVVRLYPIVTLGQKRVALLHDDLKSNEKPKPTTLTGMGVIAFSTFILGVLVFRGSVFGILEKTWNLLQTMVELAM